MAWALGGWSLESNFLQFSLFLKKITFEFLDNLISFLDLLIGVIRYDAEVIRLDAMTYGIEVIGMLDSHATLAPMWPSSAL